MPAPTAWSEGRHADPGCGYGDAGSEYIAGLSALGVPVTWTPTIANSAEVLGLAKSRRDLHDRGPRRRRPGSARRRRSERRQVVLNILARQRAPNPIERITTGRDRAHLPLAPHPDPTFEGAIRRSAFLGGRGARRGSVAASGRACTSRSGAGARPVPRSRGRGPPSSRQGTWRTPAHRRQGRRDRRQAAGPAKLVTSIKQSSAGANSRTFGAPR